MQISLPTVNLLSFGQLRPGMVVQGYHLDAKGTGTEYYLVADIAPIKFKDTVQMSKTGKRELALISLNTGIAGFSLNEYDVLRFIEITHIELNAVPKEPAH